MYFASGLSNAVCFVCAWGMGVLSSFATILLRKRKLADLLYLYSCCHMVLWVGLCSVIMEFPVHMSTRISCTVIMAFPGHM